MGKWDFVKNLYKKAKLKRRFRVVKPTRSGMSGGLWIFSVRGSSSGLFVSDDDLRTKNGKQYVRAFLLDVDDEFRRALLKGRRG